MGMQALTHLHALMAEAHQLTAARPHSSLPGRLAAARSICKSHGKFLKRCCSSAANASDVPANEVQQRLTDASQPNDSNADFEAAQWLLQRTRRVYLLRQLLLPACDGCLVAHQQAATQISNVLSTNTALRRRRCARCASHVLNADAPQVIAE